MIFFENLGKYKNVIHGVLEKKDGQVNPFSDSKAEENVLRALKKLGYGDANVDNLIFAEQVHGSKVYSCPSGPGGYIKLKADGLITKNPNQVLIIRTADCVPVLIYDPDQKKVGAIHAGRKGTMKGIIETAVKDFNCNPPSLIVGIGPHIRKCCYYFEKDIKALVSGTEAEKYIRKDKGRFYLDLTQIVIDKLLKSGIKRGNIEDCGICTFCEAERFYSARKREKHPDIYKGERIPCFGSFIGLLPGIER